MLLIKKSIFYDMPMIVEDDLEVVVGNIYNEMTIRLPFNIDSGVQITYEFQYDDEYDDDYIGIFTNGLDEDVIDNLFKRVANYYPEFEYMFE